MPKLPVRLPRRWFALSLCVLVGLCASDPLVAQDPIYLYPVDAIVVIGGDHKPARMRRAVQLYREGYAPIVIISAGTRVLEGTERLPEAQVLWRQASALGLSAAAVLLVVG